MAQMGFPGGSDSKESACNSVDLSLILGLEDPLEEGMATHSSILAGEAHGQRSQAGYSPWGHKELDMAEGLSTQHRDDQVKMRSLWWALIQYEWGPYKKGKFRDRMVHKKKAM